VRRDGHGIIRCRQHLPRHHRCGTYASAADDILLCQSGQQCACHYASLCRAVLASERLRLSLRITHRQPVSTPYHECISTVDGQLQYNAAIVVVCNSRGCLSMALRRSQTRQQWLRPTKEMVRCGAERCATRMDIVQHAQLLVQFGCISQKRGYYRSKHSHIELAARCDGGIDDRHELLLHIQQCCIWTVSRSAEERRGCQVANSTLLPRHSVAVPIFDGFTDGARLRRIAQSVYIHSHANRICCVLHGEEPIQTATHRHFADHRLTDCAICVDCGSHL
jgi:hypothetical protein